jgi:hypothetical protein
MTDFPQLIGALAGGNVEFIIVGGLAATIHGGSRLTQDIDVLYRRSDSNVDRIVAALAPFEPYLRGAPAGLPFAWSATTLKHGLNFTLTTTVGDIDLFGDIAGGGGIRGAGQAFAHRAPFRSRLSLYRSRVSHPPEAGGWQAEGLGSHRRTRSAGRGVPPTVISAVH